MSDESIVEAIKTDPDTRLIDADNFKKMRRKGLQKAPLKEHVTSTPSLDNHIIIPANQSQDDWFDAPGVSDDFMEEREQPDDQIRETL
ncbi:MAG: hypothetical protein WBM35_15310 [Candidatus Electrothrix sp.]